MIEHFKSLGVELREKLYEFKVTKDAVLPIGTELTAEHFVTGQFVDVTAPSYVYIKRKLRPQKVNFTFLIALVKVLLVS